MTVLVLGGAGYIGSHTTVELLQKGYENVLEITEKQIANMRCKLDKEEQDLKAQHKISLMTPEFQVWLVEMAIKLAKIGKLFDLLKYIQNEMWLG